MLRDRLAAVLPSTLATCDLVALDVTDTRVREVAAAFTFETGTLIAWANGDPLSFVARDAVVFVI